MLDLLGHKGGAQLDAQLPGVQPHILTLDDRAENLLSELRTAFDGRCLFALGAVAIVEGGVLVRLDLKLVAILTAVSNSVAQMNEPTWF